MRGMRKLRENLPNRVYHLISRVAHRAFFLNAEERTRFVELLKRVAAFSGVELLAYCVMTSQGSTLATLRFCRGSPSSLQSHAERAPTASAACRNLGSFSQLGDKGINVQFYYRDKSYIRFSSFRDAHAEVNVL